MSIKERITAEMETLSEDDLNELYRLLQGIKASKEHTTSRSLMSQLKSIRIDAPEDFSVRFGL